MKEDRLRPNLKTKNFHEELGKQNLTKQKENYDRRTNEEGNRIPRRTTSTT